MIPIIYADMIDDVGDLVLFEEVYEEHYRKMFFIANKILKDTYEAEDAVHDAFLGIARNIKTVRAIKNRKDLFYYVMRAAENAAYNRLPKLKRSQEPIHLDAMPNISNRSFWEALCTKLDYEQLVQAISALPQTFRDVLYYHFVMEMSIQEVARSLGLSMSATKQRLVRGKKMLRHEMEKEGRGGCGDD